MSRPTASTTNVFSETVVPLMRAAKASGATPEALSASFVAAMLRVYGRPAAKDATTAIGFFNLIRQEGGVVSSKAAAGLYGGSTPTTPEAVRKAARLGQIIAVKDGRGNLMFPKWRFSEKGGALPGLRETLGVLRQHPHFHELLPLTFFLNRRARLKGKRPVDLLRRGKEGNTRLVMTLAAEAAE